MIYRLAGIVGVDPFPYTLRQLNWMSEARLESQWDQTSNLLAMLHNVNCSSKSRMKDCFVFHPLKKKKLKPIELSPKESVQFLSAMLVPKS